MSASVSYTARKHSRPRGLTVGAAAYGAWVSFSVRIAVRSYELDALGHVNQAVYHSYAEHARVRLFEEAGATEPLLAQGVAPVLLESHAHYRKELRGGQEVDVSCGMSFGDGKVFSMPSVITFPDGRVSAEIDCTIGLMDLSVRRLVADPRERITKLVEHPELLSAS